nr:putative reverse transcriptase domain-containing protein [Tanacetum cinerariifolium]
MKKEMIMISKDGIIFKFPGYTSSKEEQDEEEEKEKAKLDGSSNDENPNIAAIIVQQLQNILPRIVNQVNNNVNNANANGGNGGAVNGGNNGCSYKTFLVCNPRDYDKKENQKVKYAVSSFINKALTWWNTQVQAKGREATMETYPTMIQSVILMVGILVRCGTLTRSSKKKKEVEETSKQGGSWKDNKKAKVGKGFMATALPRYENVGSYPKYTNCFTYPPESRPCRLCFNCQKLVIDDILIYSNTKEDHEVYLKMVLKLLKKERLYAKFFKYEFWLQEVHFLGHMVNHNGIHVDPIEDFVVYCDASNQGLGCVLMQRGQVITSASRQLKIDEKNYKTHDLELGVVVFALKTWRHYLYETKSVIYTNHKSLQHIFDQKELNMNQRRWIELFSDYECEIRFHPALNGRKCRSLVLWAEIRESGLIGSELMQETTDMVVLIKEKLKAARDCQKSYADNRRKLLEFEVRDQVLLKVSPWKGVIRFGKKGKLAPSMHETFHVSNFKKCLADANVHVPLHKIKVDKTFRFVEEPIEIMDREVKSLKRSNIPIVKVHWKSK